MQPKDQVLRVWGDLACFSRPELKVERFSYPLITPSAARGIYDAIYCKPNKDATRAQFRWQVTKVEVLAPISYIALRRNEVKDKASVKGSWVAGAELPEPIWADGTKDMLGTDMKGRTQRQTMALRDVHYQLYAQIRPFPSFEDRLPSLEAQFRRRALNGKCFYQPCFGCREFPAFFELADEQGQQAIPVSLDLDIGLMLYDVFDLSKPGNSNDDPCISLFKAKVVEGTMSIPDYDSDHVLKCSGGRF